MSKIPREKIRRGSAYVIVLAISMLVTVIGVGAITAVRVRLATATMHADAEEARVIAQSGIESARYLINAVPDWRTNSGTKGAGDVSRAVGAGAVIVTVTDPVDGDIANSTIDPIVLTATGQRRSARHKVQVTLAPELVALDCLGPAICAGGNVVSAGYVWSDGLISSNGNIASSDTYWVDADVSAVGTISGNSYLGSKVTGAAPRTMPVAADVFSYYVAHGTPITYASTGGVIQNALISPANNPFGSTTNPDGIYVIDCGGNQLQIKSSRIVGTLVLLNARFDSKIMESVNWSPAVVGMPALLVQGGFVFEVKKATLDERDQFNFNPATTPFQGSWNATKKDKFPSEINGLVYVSGAVVSKEDPVINGCLIVGGAIYWEKTLTVTYDPAIRSNPPPGFFRLPTAMKVVPSSWKQLVD